MTLTICLTKRHEKFCAQYLICLGIFLWNSSQIQAWHAQIWLQTQGSVSDTVSVWSHYSYFQWSFQCIWKSEFLSVLPNCLWEIQLRNVLFIWEEECFDPLNSSYPCVVIFLPRMPSNIERAPLWAHALQVGMHNLLATEFVVLQTHGDIRRQGFRLACRLQNWMIGNN